MIELVEDSFNALEVRKFDNKFLLFVDDKQYMAYDTVHEYEKYETLSHVNLAYGDVITTGLGFGIRERLILEKEEVNSLTVIEISKDVIKYHEKMNQEWFRNDKLKIVNADALSYKGKCDCLFIDHFEDPFTNNKIHDWLQQSQSIQKNILSKLTWVWPLELIIHMSREDSFELYKKIKNDYNLNLPSISKKQLAEYTCLFSSSSAHP